jgi:Flavin containing amine oxidoreductase
LALLAAAPRKCSLLEGIKGSDERLRQAKCHFAGEHCSINFQGFMEGGAEEGARAAQEIQGDYASGIFP